MATYILQRALQMIPVMILLGLGAVRSYRRSRRQLEQASQAMLAEQSVLTKWVMQSLGERLHADAL